MIYLELLQSKSRLPVLAGLLLQRQSTSIIVTSQDRQAGLDATILRSCWLAYLEANGALHGRNMFCFNNASQIADFRSKGLRKVLVGRNSDQSQKFETVFTFQLTPLGRLSTLQGIILILTDRPDMQGHNPYRASRDQSIMEAWSDLLFREGQRNGSERCSFPALRLLTMDFEHLGLTNEHGIAVSDYLEARRSAC